MIRMTYKITTSLERDNKHKKKSPLYTMMMFKYHSTYSNEYIMLQEGKISWFEFLF